MYVDDQDEEIEIEGELAEPEDIDGFEEEIPEEELELDSLIEDDEEEDDAETADAPRPRARKVKASDEDDEDEEEEPEDLEADLDAILKDRMAAEDDEDDEDDEDSISVVRSVRPTNSDTILCSSCFLTVNLSQLDKRDPVCPHCGELLDNVLVSS